MKNLLMILIGLTVTSAVYADTLTYQKGFDYEGTVDEYFDYNGTFGSSTGFIEFDAPSVDDTAGKYGYILFDFVFGPEEGQVPVGPSTTINSATLTGHVNNGFDSATLYRLLDTIDNRPFGGDPLILEDPGRLDAPGVAGTFYDTNGSQAFDTQPSNSPDPPVEIVWDVTDIVSEWAAGATNHGFLLLNDNDSGGQILSSAAEYQGSNHVRPLLTIVFNEPVSGITGDYDDSGHVGQADLDLVLLNWGAAVPPTPTNPVPWVNEIPTDGQVNQNDLDGVLLNWGNTLAAGAVSAVPEPSSVLMVSAMALGLVSLRKRS